MSDTYSIDVDVETEFLSEQSMPESQRYAFSYTVSITNSGSVPAKLLTRHWIITDANGEVQEVHGDGVIGEQPHLRPGQTFRYTSGTILATPVGSMHGSYQMVADDGSEFDAAIKPFSLRTGETLH